MVLPEKCQRGYIEVDLEAIRANIHNLHRRYPAATEIMAVVKTDGYGHGAVAVAQAVEGMECLYGFAVATCEEAFALRDNGIKKPLLVMGPVFPYAYERVIAAEISLILFRDDALEAVNECAKGLGKTVSVHIEVDTGMNRVGIKPDAQGFAFVEKIAGCPNLRIDGIYTHFARADEADKESTYRQIECFYAFIDSIENDLGLHIRCKHSSNSAGMLGFHDYPLTVCRPGIAIYGIWPSDEAKNFMPAAKLFPALALYSQIIMVKDLAAGEAVSYGGTYITPRPARIATVPIGYGDGYPRGLSNAGYVLVKGQKAPIVGRICMDFFMIDVTGIPGVAVGDKVTLLGSDGALCITAEELCKLFGGFSYELVCGFSKRLPRVTKS